jgi:hypothetical protein
MSRYRDMISGPAMDVLVATKFMHVPVKQFSTEPDYTAEVCRELERRGYELSVEETDTVTCELSYDSRLCVSVWGLTYEEAVCRAALKLVGSDVA